MKTILNNFTYLKELMIQAINNEPGIIKEINQTSSREGGKTDNDITMIEKLFFSISFAAHLVRYSVKDSIELFDKVANEIQDIIQDTNLQSQVSINLTKRIIRGSNEKGKQNTIRVSGLTSQTKRKGKANIKLGLSADNNKYGIIMFEEATEIPFDLQNAYIEAVRGIDNLMIIRAANPWLISNEYIAYCNANMPYNEKILVDEGKEQFEIIDGTKIFHYSIQKNNPFIKPDKLNYYEQLKKLDPLRARVSVHGLPGIADGGIYTDYLSSIKTKAEDKEQFNNEGYGGIDGGYTNDPSTFILGVTNRDNNKLFLKETGKNSNKNKIIKKTNTDQIKELLKKIKKGINKYNIPFLTVYVDSAENPIIESLNIASVKYDISHIVSFEASLKHSIIFRINVTTLMMSLGNLYGDNDKFQELKEEFSVAMGKDGKEGKERVDANDHFINAFEYLIAHISYNLIDNKTEWLRRW